MPAIKYRSIKTPPACGTISLKDAEKSARTVARSAISGRFVVKNAKSLAGSVLTQSHNTRSRAASKVRSKASKSKSGASKSASAGKR